MRKPGDAPTTLLCSTALPGGTGRELDGYPQANRRLLVIARLYDHYLAELPRRIIGKRIVHDRRADSLDDAVHLQTKNRIRRDPGRRAFPPAGSCGDALSIPGPR
jgi:hypothetical protein